MTARSNHFAEPPSRRDLFNWGINGLGATALLSLLKAESSGADSVRPLSQYEAKAKRAIHICLIGGMSHVDSFDYKPELERFHGKSLQTDEQPDIFFGKVGLLRKQDWRFKPRGDSGLMISDMFPHIAELADDLTILRSNFTSELCVILLQCHPSLSRSAELRPDFMQEFTWTPPIRRVCRQITSMVYSRGLR